MVSNGSGQYELMYFIYLNTLVSSSIIFSENFDVGGDIRGTVTLSKFINYQINITENSWDDGGIFVKSKTLISVLTC